MGDEVNSEIRQMAVELNLAIPAEITPEFTLMVLRHLRQARQRLSDLEVRNI